MRANYPYTADEEQCKMVLRHKTSYFTLDQLEAFGIPYTIVPQNPGDVIITLPGTYHQGFNVGFNVNVAVNVTCASDIDKMFVA